jgi:hypothetical protein
MHKNVFLKMKDKKVKWILSGGPVGGEGLKERMKKGEYGECILYSYAKTEQ